MTTISGGVTISDEGMKDILSRAVLESISKADRDKIIQAAVESLMTTKEEKYPYRNKLNAAVEYAVEKYAKEVVLDYFNADTAFRDKVKALVVAATDAWIAKAGEKMPDIIYRLMDNAFDHLVKDRNPY